jgi:hypothetical protein
LTRWPRQLLSPRLSDLQQFHETLSPDAAQRAQTLLNALLEALDQPDNDDDDPDQAQDRRMAGDRTSFSSALELAGGPSGLDKMIGRLPRRRAWVGDSGRGAEDMAKRFPGSVMPRQLG